MLLRGGKSLNTGLQSLSIIIVLSVSVREPPVSPAIADPITAGRAAVIIRLRHRDVYVLKPPNGTRTERSGDGKSRSPRGFIDYVPSRRSRRPPFARQTLNGAHPTLPAASATALLSPSPPRARAGTAGDRSRRPLTHDAIARTPQ